MASDRRLRELYTSKWMKAAAKSIITTCLFSLYLQAKIGKNLRIQAKAVGQLGSNCLHKLLMKNVSNQGHIYITACAAFIRLSV